MADYRTIRAGEGVSTGAIDAGLKAHMNKVYGTMSVGLVMTAAVAWAMGNLSMTSDPSVGVARIATDTYLTQLGATLFASPLKWVIMFLPLVMVFAFGAVVNRLSAAAAQLFFYVYAALMGLSISWIMIVFTGMSIATTFLVTAATFAALSLYGYTTKRDLSGFGTFLFMGVVGLIIASLVNIWLQSPAIAFAVSALGVLIFAGLTAFDTQRIKNEYIAHAHAMDSEWLGKAAIMGALNLYLDFINLFMFLIQFLGQQRE